MTRTELEMLNNTLPDISMVDAARVARYIRDKQLQLNASNIRVACQALSICAEK